VCRGQRDALIREFENYLGILKAVHSGADLQNSAKNAGSQLPGAAKGHLGYVLASHGSNQVRWTATAYMELPGTQNAGGSTQGALVSA
jgi:hypothetical protein